jgi:hypothetical protein
MVYWAVLGEHQERMKAEAKGRMISVFKNKD